MRQWAWVKRAYTRSQLEAVSSGSKQQWLRCPWTWYRERSGNRPPEPSNRSVF